MKPELVIEVIPVCRPGRSVSLAAGLLVFWKRTGPRLAPAWPPPPTLTNFCFERDWPHQSPALSGPGQVTRNS